MNGEAPCGTYAAEQRHRRRGEPVDEACRAARREYMSTYRADPEVQKRDRWWNATRVRALERLATEHPERLAEILAEVRAEGPNPWQAVRHDVA